MARAIDWQIATVEAIRPETSKVKSFRLHVPGWMAHQAGQHVDLRLTAADGYQAQRSYSIASEPERVGEIELTVERIEDGEVSAYLHDVVAEGDRIEIRGPIGGYFVWRARRGGPLLLIAGGSGVVPLMSMIRHRAAAGAKEPARLLYSSRTPEDVIYQSELDLRAGDGSGLEVVHTFTRSQPAGWKGYARRIDADMLREVALGWGNGAEVFLCGPTPLVESAAGLLVEIGLAAERIRTERFGPTGGPS